MTALPPLPIAAASTMRPDGRVLAVRERDTAASMQPGSRIGADEAPLAAPILPLGRGLAAAPVAV